jgi:hypothetical protein
MGLENLSDAELLAQIATFWLRVRSDPTVTVPLHFRQILDEATRRRGTVGATRQETDSDTPPETPISRRR